MDKLKMHSPNFAQVNIEKLARLFPGCVTEATDGKGGLKAAIDFDLLRQELSEYIVEGPQERYQLSWPGKRESLLAANSPITNALRPCLGESVNFDSTSNLFIEGDNLEALKLLQNSYLGRVKMIYIDPPYNTGSDFIYKDNFSEGSEEYLKSSNQKDDLGNRLVVNTESNGRFHSDWLSMMYPRLKLARNLLKDSGVIFLSIGQDEISSVYHVMKEIFGEENFITVCSRVMKKGGQKGVHFSPCIDYVLVFAKNIEELGPFREEISQNVIDNVYTKVEGDGPRKGARYRAMGLYQAMLDKRANQRFYIECPDGSLVIPPGESFPSVRGEGEQVSPLDGDGVWRWTYKRYEEEKRLGNIEFVQSDKTSLVNDDGSPARWNIYYKIWLSDRLEDGQLPGNILEKFESRHASAELKVLDIPFDFPKPTSLVKFFMSLCGVKEGEVVLDFFAGSGTTAHAAMEYSKDNKGNRRFICVQLPERTPGNSDEFKKGYRTIAEISKERIRRAGQLVLKSNASEQGDLDIGFRVFKIDSSNMKEVYYTPDAVSQDLLSGQIDNIREDRTPEDLLFQVLLDWGVDLALPISQETISGKQVFFVDENALVACFDKGIDEAFVKQIAEHKPLRVVFRDNGFASDSVKINVEQLFKLLSPMTEIKTL
ncbi:site-specific DNA-methyltransferase [Pseudomonas fluorescens]|uniref:site-specific DNA-methyltransferase n=1 Tax=Pseudomonas fluorescens TaxID=294 RepID=UPI00177A8F0D|nr:site-specific DNA-methyltransferase [Pseudomonas fluorescens]